MLAYCLNDASELTQRWANKHRALSQTFRSTNLLVTHSYLANTLYYRYKRKHTPDLRDYFYWALSDYEGATWSRLRASFQSLHTLVEQNGGQLKVVIFPFFHNLGPEYRFVGVHEKLAAYWARHNVPKLDLLGIFDGHASEELVVNRYDAHPNEVAHELAAKAIQRFLEGPGTG